MKYNLSKSVIDRIHTLKSNDLRHAVIDFINYTPIDFGVIENGAYRTTEEQNLIFAREPKVTNCDGYNNKSKHQSGLAVDLVPWIDGSYSWDIKHATGLATAFACYLNMKGIKFVGGFDWNGDGNLNESFYDPCHFEVLS